MRSRIYSSARQIINGGAIAVLLVATTARLMAQTTATLPVVTTRFVFATSPMNLTAGYESDQRAACRTKIAQWLADFGHDRLGFFTWRPEGSVDASSPVATLILTLTEQHGQFGDTIVLRLSGRIGPAAAKLDLPFDEPLYPETNLDKPTHDPDRLVTDIERALTRQLALDRVIAELQDKFLAHVPLADTFTIDTSLQCLTLPYSARALSIGDDSVLMARYKTAPNAQPVSLRCHPAYSDQFEQPLGCLVDYFEWLPHRKSAWDQVIVTSYQQRDATTVQVFMLKYQANGAPTLTRDGIDNRPN